MEVGASGQRSRGLILILVVDEREGGKRETIARVCRDYDVADADGIEADVRRAAWQAGNQLARRTSVYTPLR